jgi:hypothetical protein
MSREDNSTGQGMTNPFALNRRAVLRTGAASAAAVLANLAQAETGMTTRDVAVERLSVVSQKPFPAVVAAFEGGIGHPDPRDFVKDIEAAKTAEQLADVVERSASKLGLLQFARFDLGVVIATEGGTPAHSVRYLVGNPIIMSQMARHVADAGSYAPVTVLIDERADGVHLSYDKMASFLAPYGNAEALRVARDLDGKIETLLKTAAAG